LTDWFRIWGERLFPERQLLLRTDGTVRSIRLPGWLQAALVGLCLCWLGAAAYLVDVAANGSRAAQETAVVSPAKPQEAVAAAPAAPQEAAAVAPAAPQEAAAPAERQQATIAAPAAPQETAIATPPRKPVPDPSDTIADLRRQLAAANTQYSSVAAKYADASARLEKAHHDIAAVKAENGTLRGALGLAETKAKTLEKAREALEHRVHTAEQSVGANGGRVAQLTKSLEESRTALDHSEAQRTNLQNQLQELQSELQSAKAKASQLKAALDAKERQQHFAAEPNQTRAQLPEAPAVRAHPPEAESASPPAQAHGKAETHSRVQARHRPSELERLIASTGIDIDKLLAQLKSKSTPSGEGGPFIALQDARKESTQSQVRMKKLEKLAKMLPLAAPLKHYAEASDFGPRRDPFNERMGFHPGVDLAARYRSPVYSTAPGVVIFTGVQRGYGRTVEIDHGHGIVTLYAHLHRILVAKGQRVGAHHEIGQLGSTGRSTGPHVHYEIRVDGVPVDPDKFIQAGKNVVQINTK
jgi:murein DD-endopeptidase MepM/ murein hydrolase activator NlpD